jgi:hypothetical protein
MSFTMLKWTNWSGRPPRPLIEFRLASCKNFSVTCDAIFLTRKKNRRQFSAGVTVHKRNVLHDSESWNSACGSRRSLVEKLVYQ